MPGRAVVVGAGVGGMAAAAALQRAGVPTTLVERDPVRDDHAPRRGAPQSRQLHNLLTRAQRHLEELFPGFTAAFEGAGGVRAKVASETHVREFGSVMPERDLGLELWCAPRPVIEHVLRTLLPAEVLLLPDQDARRFTIDPHGRIEGVELGDGRVLTADLVVDASGAASRIRSPYTGRVRTEVAHVDQWYATTIVERPGQHIGRPDFWLAFPTPPSTRGLLISPAGQAHWYVSVSGRADDPAPRTFTDVLSYGEDFDELGTGELLASVRDGSHPTVYRRPRAIWRHFEDVAPAIEGYLPIGDAIATLNPLHGQGMSVAAWQAAELASILGGAPDLAAVTRTYLDRAASVVSGAWALEEVGGTLDPAEWARLAERIEADPTIHRRYVGLWHLLEPVSWLREVVTDGYVMKWDDLGMGPTR